MKNYLFLLSMALLSQIALSQSGSDCCKGTSSQSSILSYDLSCDPIISGERLVCRKCKPQTVCYNSLVRIQLCGVNTLLYDIKVEGTPIEYHTEIPDLFKNESLEENEADTSQNDTALASAIVSQLLFALDGDNGSKEVDKLMSLEDELYRAINQLEQVKVWAGQLRAVFLSDCIISSDIHNKSLLMGGYDEISVVTFMKKALADYRTARFEYQSQYFKMKADSRFDGNEALTRLFTENDKLIETVNQTNYEKLTADLADFYASITPDILCYTSQPLLANGDALEIEVTITKKQVEDDEIIQPTVFNLPTIYTCGGIKIDFSEGPFFSSLTDEQYTLNGDNQITEGNSSLADYGLGALMHVYKRNPRNYQFTGSFGIFINENQDMRYVLGPSVFWGRERRLVATAGVAYGQRSILSNSQQEGLELASGNVEDIKYDKVGQLGLFLSITYNL